MIGIAFSIFALACIFVAPPAADQTSPVVRASHHFTWPDGFARDVRIAQWDATGSARAVASCTHETPAGEHVRKEYCEQLFCLRSAANPDVWIDLTFRAFTPAHLTSNKAFAVCTTPFGGQDGIASRKTTQTQVSFIFTVYNNVDLVKRSILEAFRTSREADSVEYIVVDDGSTDDTSEIERIGSVIREHFGVPFKLIKNVGKRGFGQANNAGAREAVGEYLAILNSDAFVTRGWLATLLASMRQDGLGTKVGIAGPLFLNSTGYIMEAGGIIWNDASAANYGRGEMPSHRFLYSRFVDYMSAACWMVRRDLFRSIDGFNAMYGLGYW